MEHQKNSINNHKQFKVYLMQFKTKNGTVIDLLTDNDVYNLNLGSQGITEVNEIPDKMRNLFRNLSDEIKNKLDVKTFIGNVRFKTCYWFIGTYVNYLNGYFSLMMYSYESNTPLAILMVNGSVRAFKLNATEM